MESTLFPDWMDDFYDKCSIFYGGIIRTTARRITIRTNQMYGRSISGKMEKLIKYSPFESTQESEYFCQNQFKIGFGSRQMDRFNCFC